MILVIATGVDYHCSLILADYLVTKCGVLMMSLFVFFTTTMSVSFTLRETQTRMLKFTGFLLPSTPSPSSLSSFLPICSLCDQYAMQFLVLFFLVIYFDNPSAPTLCSTASTSCSSQASNISTDICACDWIPCLCPGNCVHSDWFKLNHSHFLFHLILVSRLP